jgi:hypothetical protein
LNCKATAHIAVKILCSCRKDEEDEAATGGNLRQINGTGSTRVPQSKIFHSVQVNCSISHGPAMARLDTQQSMS